MSTRKDLLKEFEKMESERLAIVQKMKTHPIAKLDQKPSADAWSVSEVVLHLVVAETASYNYMKKKLELGGHSKAKASAGIKQWLLSLAISLPIKFKAPKIAEIKEGSNITFDEAEKQWTAIRNAMRSEYNTIDETIIDNELFKHPSAGKLSAMHSVRFMRQHMNRHIKQMERAIAQVG